MPRNVPATKKIHPMRLSGRLTATMVPIEMPTMFAITDSALARLQPNWLADGGTTAARSTNIRTRPALISAIAEPPIHVATLDGFRSFITATDDAARGPRHGRG